MTGLQHIMCHQPPMVFLDEVVESRHEGLTAVVRIRDGIPFYAADRGVPAWVGIEYMAQSIAALAGIRARNAGEDVPLGLIIGCRKYVSTTAAFAPGSELRISVEELIAEENGFGSFDCIIKDAGIIAEARISVFGGDRQEVT
jgi:predicted hotdog family 3-hydroxylacyl-ACP dehydratase